ncbi:hypothetical protein [Allofournierella massiliensis]|uniref:hypothetical protein n=1 Tax=Allofournierella massiliensis TaxID=1650663 RepID=UPI0025A39157|nr:hypothetical protein [Fournierella massiliensis]
MQQKNRPLSENTTQQTPPRAVAQSGCYACEEFLDGTVHMQILLMRGRLARKFALLYHSGKLFARIFSAKENSPDPSRSGGV